MYELGDVLSQNEHYYAVIETHKNYLHLFECNLIDDQYTVNITETFEYNKSEINNSFKKVGTLSDSELEKAKRATIFEKHKEFYQLFHQKSPFVEGETQLNYAGKIYDEREMVALADASLDFWLTAGRFCKEFEKKLAEYLGVKYSLLTNSGSSANLLAISSLTSPKLGDRRLLPSDEVITVAAGFPTTVAPIIQNQLVPVFVDVELGTYNIKVDEIEQAISERTKAIMIAHTMGNPFDLGVVMQIAEKYNLWVIEDNCDALGAEYNGKLTGTHGHIGTSSFYPPHHMTMGEGGAVYTNDPLLKMILESFRDWGRDCWCPSGCDNTCNKRFGWQLGELPQGYDHKYTYSHVGYNLKVTDMQAAIGLEQLKKLPGFIERRNHNFNRLKNNLKVVEDKLILPEATVNSEPSWFGFIITVRDGSGLSRNKITQYLEDNKVQTRMLFAGNLVKQPAFMNVNYRKASDLVNTDKILEDTFLVGVYPGLTDEMIDYMSSLIISAINTNG